MAIFKSFMAVRPTNENADKVDTSEFLFYRSDRKEIKNDVSV